MNIIELKNVSKIYNKNYALKNINLEIKKGDIYGIIGYSGAGKSTLIRLMNGLEIATEGEVRVLEEDFCKINKEKIRLKRKNIGMIFQHFNLLWSRTVAENIALPLEILGLNKNEIKNKVAELIKLVDLEEKKDDYPASLSGGQKQRVGIARALAGDPKILLCDEATSALDPEMTAEILELINEIHKKTNITVVLITHEMNVVKTLCNKVAVINNGEILEKGLVTDVFLKPKNDVTKKFLKKELFSSEKSADKSINNWKKSFINGKIVKLTFNDKNFNEPIVAEITKKLDVKVNIIQGKINKTKIGNIGILYAQLLGEENNIKETIIKLEKLEIMVEEL